MLQRSRRINDLGLPDEPAKLPQDSLARGKESADRAEVILKFLVMVGEIHDYHRSWDSAELDRQGMDFLIFPEADWIIPLQVKSSQRGKWDHIAKYGTRIPCVVIRPEENLIKQAREILQVLGLSTHNLLVYIAREREVPQPEQLDLQFEKQQEETTSPGCA